MHFVYVLYSPAKDRYYIGETVNPEGRLVEHNSGHYYHASTAFANDWQIALILITNNRKQALIVEKYLKSMKSKKYLRKLIDETDSLELFKKVTQEKFNIELR